MSPDAILKTECTGHRAPSFVSVLSHCLLVLSKCDSSMRRRYLDSILFRTFRYISYCFLRVRSIVEYYDRCDYSMIMPDYVGPVTSHRFGTVRLCTDSSPGRGQGG